MRVFADTEPIKGGFLHLLEVNQKKTRHQAGLV